MNEGSLLCLTGPTDAIPRPTEIMSLRFLLRPDQRQKMHGLSAQRTPYRPRIGL